MGFVTMVSAVEGRSAFLIPGFWMRFFTAGVFLVFLRVSRLSWVTQIPFLFCFVFVMCVSGWRMVGP